MKKRNLFLSLSLGLTVLLLGACAAPVVEEEPQDPFLDDPIMDEQMDTEEEMEMDDELIWDEDMEWEEEEDMELEEEEEDMDLEDEEEDMEIQVE